MHANTCRTRHEDTAVPLMMLCRALWLWEQIQQDALVSTQAMQALQQTHRPPRQPSRLPCRHRLPLAPHLRALTPTETSRVPLRRPLSHKPPQGPTPHPPQLPRSRSRRAARQAGRRPSRQLPQQPPRPSRCLLKTPLPPALQQPHLLQMLPPAAAVAPQHRQRRPAAARKCWMPGARWWMRGCGCRGPACGRSTPARRTHLCRPLPAS